MQGVGKTKFTEEEMMEDMTPQQLRKYIGKKRQEETLKKIRKEAEDKKNKSDTTNTAPKSIGSNYKKFIDFV